MKFSYLVVLASATFITVTFSKLKSFGPELARKTFEVKIQSKIEPEKSRRVSRDAEDLFYLKHAKSYLKSELGYSESTDYIVKKHFSSNSGVGYLYLRQVILGKEVFNADININILKNSGKVLSIGSSFFKYNIKSEDEDAFRKAKYNLFDYLKSALEQSQVSYSKLNKQQFQESVKYAQDRFTYVDKTNEVNDFKGQLGWMLLGNSELEPVWTIDIKLSTKYWFNAVVSIKNSKLISLADWTSEVGYRVFPITQFGPEDGERQLMYNPYDNKASPLGWHNDGTNQYSYTRGNNVYVKLPNSKDIHSKAINGQNEVHQNLKNNFDFLLDINNPDYTAYKSASATNLFYVCNMMHDILYRYGFDEASGNFQKKNFGKDGIPNDSVQAYAQDETANNDAMISVPEDGKAPILIMGIYDRSNPKRDSSLENNIIIHEYGHGLSHRLVGGAYNPNCLSTLESSGMGEGWSDMLAVLLSMKKEYTREQEFGMSGFSNNKPTGVRPSRYSVSFKTNDVKYASLNGISVPHNIGHVWATMLYEVYWNLVDKLSFTSDWFGEGAKHPTNYGNTLMLKLIIESMKLMPCNPTFLDARDNILTADLLLTNGSNECEIWKAFAKRGLGVDAYYKIFIHDLKISTFNSQTGWTYSELPTNDKFYFDDHTLPKGC